MATRRFCDLCDQQLKPEDAQPLVRALSYTPVSSTGERDWPEGEPEPQAVAYVEITNQNNKPLTDICMRCKLRIVTDGLPTTKPSPVPIATLQPNVPADRKAPVTLFRAGQAPSSLLSETPPTVPKPEPPIIFEPSMPVAPISAT